MKALAFSPAAEADLSHIWDYSAEVWGPDQADHYLDEIQMACKALATGRRQGRVVDVRPVYLKLAVASHVIFYREEDSRLLIIRVLHGRMDIDRHL
jgi:toxin ParE1/3/4